MFKHSHPRMLVWLGPLALTFAGAGLAQGMEKTTAEPSQTPECKDAGVTVSFVTGSNDIDQNGRGALAGVATWMQNGEHRTVRLQGYSDKRGSATMNQKLSEERAQAAKDFLLGRGIEPDRIMTFGHGEQQDGQGPNARVVKVTACDVPKEIAAQTPAEETSAPQAEAEPTPPAPEPAPVAETSPPAPPIYAPVTVLPPPAPVVKHDVPPSILGMEATVGGGVTGFIDETPRNVATTGGSWEARLMFGSRLPLAVEAAYVGSAQSIDALGLANNAVLVGNGAEGDLRLNLSRSRVQPYLFGGVGWTHYQLANMSNVSNTSSVLSTDDIGTVPLGAGVAARLGRSFIVDVRGTYRATFNDDLFRAMSANNNSLQNWNATGRLGFEF
jgi:hypothetical protein